MSQPLYIRDLKEGETYTDILSGDRVVVLGGARRAEWACAHGIRYNRITGEQTTVDISDKQLMEELVPEESKPEKPVKTTNAPLYASAYAKLVPVARQHGYALAIHGSMARDLDLVAVPWVAHPSSPTNLVAAFAEAVYFNSTSGPSPALHGREIWTLTFPGECFVDLSVMAVSEAR